MNIYDDKERHVTEVIFNEAMANQLQVLNQIMEINHNNAKVVAIELKKANVALDHIARNASPHGRTHDYETVLEIAKKLEQVK